MPAQRCGDLFLAALACRTSGPEASNGSTDASGFVDAGVNDGGGETFER
jgi:hypothetical protein